MISMMIWMVTAIASVIALFYLVVFCSMVIGLVVCWFLETRDRFITWKAQAWFARKQS